MRTLVRRVGSLAFLFPLVAAVIAFLLAPSRCAAADAESETVRVDGTVIDAQGQPVGGATIVAYTYEPETVETTSDAAGEFSLELPQKRAAGSPVVASHDGLLGYQMIYRPGEDAVKKLRLELAKPRTLNVTVVDCEKQLAAGIEVAVQSDYRVFARATTDAEGRAELVVPAATPLQSVVAYGKSGVDYALFRRAEQPRSDPYKLEPDFAGEIALALTPCQAVTVHVVDGQGDPVADARLSPWYLSLPKHGGGGDIAQVGALWQSTTNENGIATVDYLPLENTSPIVIWVNKEDFVATERTKFDPQSDETELTATLLPLVPVRGTVTQADGSPAVGATVDVVGNGFTLDSFRGSTETREDGSFELMVNPDQYCLFTTQHNEQVSKIVSRVVLGQTPEVVALQLGPGTHVFGRVTAANTQGPAPNQSVSLYRRSSVRYRDLPKDQQLPNPTGTNAAISPVFAQFLRTDPLGNFDFWTGSGRHSISCRNATREQEFDVTEPTEVEVNFEVPLKRDEMLQGRVVLAANPTQGVPNVKVFGYPENIFKNHLSATTDADGKFEARWDGLPQLVGVFQDDSHLGTIQRIEGELERLTLELAPTVSIRGVLFDEETQGLAVERDISVSIRVGEAHGPFMSAFKHSAKTDEEGNFEIAGLVPGQKYEVNVVTEYDKEIGARSWRTVSHVEADASQSVTDVGTLSLPAPYRPPTLEEIIARKYAGDNPQERLQQAVTDAKLGYQQVLVIVGPQDSPLVRQFFEPFQAAARAARDFRHATVQFQIVGLDIQQAEALKSLDVAELPQQEALLVVLPSGEIAAQKPFSEFLNEGDLDLAALGDFLRQQADQTHLPDATASFQAALDQAQRENKRVLVQVSGAGCGWCVVLSRYLDKYADLVAKDYVYLKLDSRMVHGKEQIAAVRPDSSGGIPWMVILDAEGNPLITSDSAEGNIGYPGEDAGKEYFRSMLATTAQHLSEAEIEELIAGLEKK